MTIKISAPSSQKKLFNSLRLFLSAAKPTDQGEESVVVVVLLVVVVGGTIFQSPICTVFWGVKRQKLCHKSGVKRQ